MTLERRRRRRGLSLSSQNSITKKEKRKIDNPKKNKKKTFQHYVFPSPSRTGCQMLERERLFLVGFLLPHTLRLSPSLPLSLHATCILISRTFFYGLNLKIF